MSNGLFSTEQKCPICGRNYIRYSDWAYKRYTRKGDAVYYCSWGCLREWERRRKHGKDNADGRV